MKTPGLVAAPRGTLQARERRLRAPAPERGQRARDGAGVSNRGVAGRDGQGARARASVHAGLASRDPRRAGDAPDRARPTAEADARKAALAATAAVSARTALIDRIDAQRDLNARFVSELQSAQQKLSDTVRPSRRTARPCPFVPSRVRSTGPPWDESRRGSAPDAGRDSAPPSRAAASRSPRPPARPWRRSTKARSRLPRRSAASARWSSSTMGRTPTRSTAICRRWPSQRERTSIGARAWDWSGSAPAGQPALYFEMRVDGKAVDPLQWLKPRY